MHYDLTPDELAEHHARFITEYGVSAWSAAAVAPPRTICRPWSTPAGDLTPAAAPAGLGARRARRSTATCPTTRRPSFLVVGERTNANGSKKFREAMLADDWDTCVAMARDAASKEGAHVLDVCVDYTGEDGVADMREVASRFATQATLPIMLDSTEPPVIETGLQLIAGKPILNSVNLEDGDAPGTRLDRFLTLAREYGAAVVCTCIDTEGQARTAEWKLRAATRHPRPGRRALRAGARATCSSTPWSCRISHGHGGEPPGRDRDHRGHPADQGRAPRRAHDRGAVQRQLRPEPGRPPRPQLGVPPRVPAGRPRRRHRPRGPHHAAAQDRPRARWRSAST